MPATAPTEGVTAPSAAPAPLTGVTRTFCCFRTVEPGLTRTFCWAPAFPLTGLTLTLTLTFVFFLGGWWSVIVVPDQPLLLFGRGWSGTFETERSHPPAPGRPVVFEYVGPVQRPVFRARGCPGRARLVSGRCAGIRYAFCNRPVRPSDCQSALVGGRRAIPAAFPLWCSRLYTGRPHVDRSIVELILSTGFMSEGDLISWSEAAQSVSHDIGEVHPATARGVCGVDHSKASVPVPRSDRSSAHAVITCHNARW